MVVVDSETPKGQGPVAPPVDDEETRREKEVIARGIKAWSEELGVTGHVLARKILLSAISEHEAPSALDPNPQEPPPDQTEAEMLCDLAHGYGNARMRLREMAVELEEDFQIDLEADYFEAFIAKLRSPNGIQFAETFLKMRSEGVEGPISTEPKSMVLVRDYVMSRGFTPVSASEVSEATGIPKKRVWSCLPTLQKLGWLKKTDIRETPWIWSGQTEGPMSYVYVPIEETGALDALRKLLDIGEYFTASDLAGFMGRSGGAVASTLRALGRRGYIMKYGRKWRILASAAQLGGH